MSNKNIPGIYNYCDRWCERCTFTERCLNYSMTKDDEFNENATAEEHSTNALQKVSSVFEDITKMLQEKANELGIDWDEVLKNAEEESHKNDHEDLMNEETSLLANKYAEAAYAFTERAKLDDAMNQMLQQRVDLGLSDIEKVTKEAALINDCFEVIQWYMFFIPSKVFRAISGKKQDNDVWDDPVQSDYNGSAKISLLAIDKSLLSFQYLLPYYNEDEVLDKLAMLSELKRKLLEEFPQAMDFVRPGFDE